MHRSATSLVAKGLHEAGVYMGTEMLGPSASNPHGHWENRDFLTLHEEMLQSEGYSWDNPPSEDHTIFRHYHEQMSNVLTQTRQAAGTRAWGWKDPRTVIFADMYIHMLRNDLNCQVFLVSCWRNVQEIADSLKKRNNMSGEKAERLAAYYHDRMGVAEWLNSQY